ncbi:MAG: PQQ-binding-like beta-propeller repeat protein [Thermoguttaceae bacterium]|jgi:outer membrane protein assembly factor BamB
MKNANLSIGVVVGCVVLIGAACVFAQDWPQWGGLNRDGKVTGFTAPETWPKELTQKWKTTVGLGDSTPALVGDKIYVFARQGDDEVILCLNAADRTELWKNKYAVEAIKGPSASVHSGPRSSPAVAEGKVVTIGVSGILSCVDAANGKDVWRKDEYPKIVPQFYTGSSPMIVDGMCIAQLGGKSEGAIMAFDLNTGDLKWKWAGEGPQYASPVLMTADGTKQIVALTDKSIVGVALADGKLLWKKSFEPKGMAYNAATPIIDGQTVIYTGSGRGAKAVKIEKQGDEFTVKELWSAQLAPQFNSPVLKDGLIYCISDKGKMFCLNAADGKEAWTASDNIGKFGSIVDAGPVLFGLPEKTGLIVFKPGDKQFEELARYKVSDTPIYAHPIIAGNRIFVKDKDSLTLWMIQ